VLCRKLWQGAVRTAVPMRVIADPLGQVEDLGHGQDGALGCLLASRSPDPAGIARQDLALFHGGHQHGAQQPACPGCCRRRYALLCAGRRLPSFGQVGQCGEMVRK